MVTYRALGAGEGAGAGRLPASGEEPHHRSRKTGGGPHRNEHFRIEQFRRNLLLQLLPKRQPGSIVGPCPYGSSYGSSYGYGSLPYPHLYHRK
jgi:hypothetical protein